MSRPASSRSICRRRSDNPSSSRTARAPRAASAQRRSQTRTPTAIRCYAETSLRSSCCPRSATIATTTRAKPSSPSRRFPKIMRCWSSIPHFPRRRCRELVAYAKANPGKLNYGSAGHGNATHLVAELFKLRTIVHVPYNGPADAVTGVLGGQVPMFFGDIGGVLALVREGALRPLAVSSETRNAFLPDVPTMMESGVPDYVVVTYIGVVAPAGTPQGIVVKLNSAINESFASAQVTAGLAQLGAGVRCGPPEAVD